MRKSNVYFIHANDSIEICHDACRLCYKSKGRDTREGKLKYIEGKIKVGHESIIEHSNVVMLLSFDSNDISMHKDLNQVMVAGKHLNYNIKYSNNIAYVLIGGNIRAYKNIYRNIKSGNNQVLNLITEILYRTPREFYYDLIQAGIMNPRSFIDSEFFEGKNSIYKHLDNKYYNISNADDLFNSMKFVDKITNDPLLFEIDDYLDMFTVTVYFKRVSRIISQQITRHRNAISQKSQRYVSEGDGEFIHPYEFKDEDRSSIVKARIEYSIYNDDTDIKSFDDLSDDAIHLYNELIRLGMLKEDARYYLPQNINTELYMTFTLRNLIHFIYLRKTKAAQAEIRNLANLLYKDFQDIYGYYKMDEDLSVYLLPKYVLSENGYNVQDAFIDEIL